MIHVGIHCMSTSLVCVWGGVGFLKITSKNRVKVEAWFSGFLFSRQLWLKNAHFKVPLLYQTGA